MVMNDPLITTNFVVDMNSTASLLAGLITQAQGIRGITVDPRNFGALVQEATTGIVSAVLNYVVVERRTGQHVDTAIDLQAVADKIVYGINSYGFGKEMSDAMALDTVNKTERFWIESLANVIPDVDDDGVSINGFVVHPMGSVQISMTYPQSYQNAKSR
jgi:hypothetical protein